MSGGGGVAAPGGVSRFPRGAAPSGAAPSGAAPSGAAAAQTPTRARFCSLLRAAAGTPVDLFTPTPPVVAHAAGVGELRLGPAPPELAVWMDTEPDEVMRIKANGWETMWTAKAPLQGWGV